MSTFFASTFLHGLNFQLGAVLMSLGFFSYVESKFRSKISALFDASLVARRHPKDNFKHQEGSFMVMLINCGFGVLTVIHLMYLGVMFDQSDLQTEGYRWTHTIAKWQALGFFSHIFMAIMFVLSFIIWSFTNQIHSHIAFPKWFSNQTSRVSNKRIAIYSGYWICWLK